MAQTSHWVWVVLWIALLGVSRAVQPDPEVEDVNSPEFRHRVIMVLGACGGAQAKDPECQREFQRIWAAFERYVRQKEAKMAADIESMVNGMRSTHAEIVRMSDEAYERSTQTQREFDDVVKNFFSQSEELSTRTKRESDNIVSQLEELSARMKRESDNIFRQSEELSALMKRESDDAVRQRDDAVRQSDDAVRNVNPGLKKGPRVSLGPAEYMEDPGFQLEVLSVIQTCIDTIPAGTCSFETLQAFWTELLVKGVHPSVRATALYTTVVSNYAVAVADKTSRSLDVEIAE